MSDLHKFNFLEGGRLNLSLFSLPLSISQENHEDRLINQIISRQLKDNILTEVSAKKNFKN